MPQYQITFTAAYPMKIEVTAPSLAEVQTIADYLLAYTPKLDTLGYVFPSITVIQVDESAQADTEPTFEQMKE